MKSFFSPKIIFIVGPTAVGKTAAALHLASEIPSEIVSCDAMQVYRDISIASSKPTQAEQQKVKHHLLDIVSVEEKFDVAAYNKLATMAIEKIIADQKYPLVVGGSGMYVQVLLDGIFEAGEQNVEQRKVLEQEGAKKLFDRLQKVDPDAALKIHANDLRRLVRALEVYETTKQPISQLQKQRSGLSSQYPVVVVGLNRERNELYRMIDQRVDQMFNDGLIDEVHAIFARPLSITAQRMIGVREVLAHLRGEMSLADAKELMKMNTRRFAKRQMTWFRKDKRIRWLMLQATESAKDISQRILREIDQ